MLLTPEAANKGEAWCLCPHHPQPGQQRTASSHEQHALPLVAALAAGGLWATDSKMLGRHKGASDFIFVAAPGCPPRWVAVEVDGETHFEQPDSRSTRAQRERQDREKDEAAWAAGLPLVRLHHLDKGTWAWALAAARCYVAAGCRRLLLYTEEYTKASRLEPDTGGARDINWRQVRAGRGGGGWGTCLGSEVLGRAPASAVADPVGA